MSASQNRNPGSAGPGAPPGLRHAPLPSQARQAAPPPQPSTHTFSDDFQQILFLLGQLAFLYVNHCFRQLDRYCFFGSIKKKRRVCIRNASRKVRQLETRTLSSQPRKRSNSLHPPRGWRAAGELGRAGRAVSAGPVVVSAPRESLARPGGGAAGGGSEILPLEQPGKEKPNGENQRGEIKCLLHVSHRHPFRCTYLGTHSI